MKRRMAIDSSIFQNNNNTITLLDDISDYFLKQTMDNIIINGDNSNDVIVLHSRISKEGIERLLRGELDETICKVIVLSLREEIFEDNLRECLEGLLIKEGIDVTIDKIVHNYNNEFFELLVTCLKKY